MIKILIKLLINIISLLDSNQYSSEKLIKSFSLNGISIKTDTGFKKVSAIHQTIPFKIYYIKTKNGLSLQCADNHICFDENMNEKFIKDFNIGDRIQTEFGIDTIKNITFINNNVSMCDITVDDNNHRFYSNNILSHNTTTSAIFLLHYILFNFDKNALVLGNKRKTAVEILDKVKKIFLEIPYFLKPGVYKWNEGEIVFDNGCRIMAEATTINSGISYTFHCVLSDEFAHIQPNILESFYENLFPTITAGKARFIISSTQNGFNLFYRLYSAAVNGENEYAPFKVDWWQVPEWDPDERKWKERDEAWHKLQIANYGSEEAFNRQFGTEFELNTCSLISGPYLKKVKKSQQKYINKDLFGVSGSEYFYWKPDIEPMEILKQNAGIITIDIAEGNGGDYTVFMINLLKGTNENNDEGKHNLLSDVDNIQLVNVGYFASNKISIYDSTIILKDFFSLYCNTKNWLISFENNTYGDLFFTFIIQLIEKDPQNINNFNEDVFVKYYNDSKTSFQYGIKLTHANKEKHCKLFKLSYERDKYSCADVNFINELTNFCDRSGNGKYGALIGHDDLVMSAMQTEFVKETLQYKNLVNDINVINNIEGINMYNPYELFNNNIYNMDIYDDELNRRRIIN